MKKALILVIILVVVVFFVSNRADKAVDIQNEPIKIGALLSLTGEASAWGENSKRGIEMAAEEINSSGGINGRRIEMIYTDTASDPKQSVSAFNLVTNIEKVTANIGPLNQTEVASVIQLIEKNKIPTVVPGYLPLKDRVNLDNPIFCGQMLSGKLNSLLSMYIQVVFERLG